MSFICENANKNKINKINLRLDNGLLFNLLSRSISRTKDFNELSENQYGIA